MAENPRRGDIWWVDLGIAGKLRPCLVMSDPPGEDELALVTIIEYTTALRGNQWEVVIRRPFLRGGAFQIQEITTVPIARFKRRVGTLSFSEMQKIQTCLRRWLGI